MNNIVFTMTGLGNCGKDTVANMIKQYVEESGKKAFTIAYADWLKSLATRNFGYDGNNKEQGRHILQEFGTQVREIEEEFWLRVVWNTIDAFRNLFDVFIITDVRYENERNPYPWRLCYPIFNVYIKNDNLQSKLGEQEKQHESEYLANNPSLEKFHFIVDNSGTLEETYEQVKQMVDMVMEQQRKYLDDLNGASDEVLSH